MKTGLIGAGLQGWRRSRAIKESGETELVIVASGHQEKARRLADEMGCRAVASWEEVVRNEDVEVLLICTPTNLHAPMAIEALKRGKHVLCEKPLAKNIREAEEIVNTARANRVKVKCGFNLRHHPGIQQARKWIDEGAIGEPVFLRCRYGIGGRPGYEKEWRMDPEISGGGQLMDQGMHALDLARWFLGDFTEVSGFLQTAYWDIAPLEDNAFAMLRAKKWEIASIHVSWTQWKNLFSLEIYGRDGYITVEGLGGSYGVEKAILGKRAFLKPFQEEVIEFRGEDRSWQGEWAEFMKAIKENREPLGSGLDGLEVLRLADAIYQSAQKGSVVRVKE
jgi:predicted dehydrogenase